MWELLIIPIIAVGVWIVGTLLRNAEDAKNPGKKPETVTDLDRFLREARRRKEAGERSVAPPRRTERTEQSSQTTERRREPRPRVRRQIPVLQEAIPVAIVVEELATAQPVSMAPVLSVLEAPPLPRQERVTASPRSVSSTALAGVRQLLASREGLCQAMILREVLGPPLSRRR